MTIRLSEIQITKVSDVSSTPLQEVSGEVFYKPPAGSMDDGLLLPAVRIDDGEASIKDGTSNTVLFSERYGSPDDEYVLTAVQHVSQPEASVPETGDEVLIGFEFGDVNGGEDSRGLFQINVDPAQPNVGTFDCSELTQWASGTPQEGDVRKGDWITDVTYESDTGSHALYQDVFVPTLDTETLIIAHEGFWY
jgi:hypothetical protein